MIDKQWVSHGASTLVAQSSAWSSQITDRKKSKKFTEVIKKVLDNLGGKSSGNRPGGKCTVSFELE